MKPAKFLIIEWEDPASEFDGWTHLGDMDAKSMDLVYSIGWPAREDKTHLYLVMDFSEGKGNTVGKIPKNAIKRVREVKFRGFPKRKVPGDGQNSSEFVCVPGQ